MSIELIHGISQKRAEALRKRGILKVDQLVRLELNDLEEILNIPSHVATDILQRAKLYTEKAVVVKTKINLPDPSDVIYFDIEADPYMRKKIFLISFATNTNEVVTFFKDEITGFLRTVGTWLAERKENILISSSGDNWDFNILNQILRSRLGKRNPLNNKRGIDLKKSLDKHIVSPVGLGVKTFSSYLECPYDYSVKNDSRVMKYLNKPINGKFKSGYIIGKIYKKGKFGDDFVDAIKEYNRSDVLQLRYIYQIVQPLMYKPPGKYFVDGR